LCCGKNEECNNVVCVVAICSVKFLCFGLGGGWLPRGVVKWNGRMTRV